MRSIIRFLILCCGVRLACATDIYREPWHWHDDFPRQSAASLHPALSVASFGRFRFGPHTSVKQIIAAFGRPSGFARQFPVTQAEGVPIERLNGYGLEAGTFRYALQDGSEVFICVRDFRTITAVICFTRRGQPRTIYTQDT